MNFSRCLFFIVIAGSFLSSGCVIETTTTTATHILNTKIDGPMTDIPIHVTTPNTPHTATLTPFFSLGTKKPFIGDVEGSTPWQQYGFYPRDTVYSANGKKTVVRRIPDHNFTWNPSSMVFGGDVDIVGKCSAFSGGLVFSRIGGATNMGGHVNVGIFAAERNVGVRFDVGVEVGRVYSQTSSVAVTTHELKSWWCTSTWTDTMFYFDEVSQTRFNYFAPLTFNTAFDRFPANVVVQGAVHVQKFFSYAPSQRYSQAYLMLIPCDQSSSKEEVSLSSVCFSLAPGVFVDITKRIRLISGARFVWPLSASIAQPSLLVSPFARIDILLGRPSTSK